MCSHLEFSSGFPFPTSKKEALYPEKGTEKGKTYDQRYGTAFIQGEKIDSDLSLLKGDDGEKGL